MEDEKLMSWPGALVDPPNALNITCTRTNSAKVSNQQDFGGSKLNFGETKKETTHTNHEDFDVYPKISNFFSTFDKRDESSSPLPSSEFLRISDVDVFFPMVKALRWSYRSESTVVLQRFVVGFVAPPQSKTAGQLFATSFFSNVVKDDCVFVKVIIMDCTVHACQIVTAPSGSFKEIFCRVMIGYVHVSDSIPD